MTDRSGPGAELGTQNLEKLAGTQLDITDRAELLDTQTECTFVYLNEDGWPCGVVMSYIQVDGVFWLTAVEGRGHVRALARDQRVSIVVSSAGSGLPGRRMLSVRGEVTVHRDQATKDWFLDRLSVTGDIGSADGSPVLLPVPGGATSLQAGHLDIAFGGESQSWQANIAANGFSNGTLSAKTLAIRGGGAPR